MKEQDTLATLRLKTRFENMHPETINVIYKARAYAWGENGRIVWHLGRTRAC